jgi:hypothetical protein
VSETQVRRKYVRRNWEALIAQWRSSGKSRSAFCAEAEVPLASFCSAVVRQGADAAETAPSGFKRLTFSTATTAEIVVDLPHGIRISLRGVDPADLVRRLIKEI